MSKNNYQSATTGFSGIGIFAGLFMLVIYWRAALVLLVLAGIAGGVYYLIESGNAPTAVISIVLVIGLFSYIAALDWLGDKFDDWRNK